MSNDEGDVVDLLTREHQVLRGLVEQLDREDDPAQLTAIFALLARKLASHEAGEQQVLFPAFREAVRTGEATAIHRIDEHEEINELLAEMRELTPNDVGFEKRAGALFFELEAHFAAEEDDVFPRLRASISSLELMALGDRLRDVEDVAPPFPEPALSEHVHAERRPPKVSP